MNILFVAADSIQEWNSSEWRMAIPCRALQRLPGHGAAIINTEQFEASIRERSAEGAMVGQVDVIMYQRNMATEGAFKAANYWRNAGKAIVVDIDDGYTLLPPTNFAYRYWYENGGDKINNLKRMVPLMDGVSSPSKVILKDWQELGAQNTYHLPNYAQLDRFIGVRRTPHEGFWVGWGGSHSHYDTWWRSGCAEGLKLACERHPDMLVTIWGSDRSIFDAIPVPENQKRYMGSVHPTKIEEWPPALAQFDVSLAPLGGEYDQRRSWIHALEPMLCRVPWIASKGAPTADLARWGRIVEHDAPEEWAAQIDDAYANRDRFVEDGYIQALNLTMERNAGQYMETMIKILQRRRLQCGAKMPGVIRV